MGLWLKEKNSWKKVQCEEIENYAISTKLTQSSGLWLGFDLNQMHNALYLFFVPFRGKYGPLTMVLDTVCQKRPNDINR